MIITEIQHFFSKIIRFQATFKGTVEFTCALEFKISSQLFLVALTKRTPVGRPEFLQETETKHTSQSAVNWQLTVVSAANHFRISNFRQSVYSKEVRWQIITCPFPLKNN